MSSHDWKLTASIASGRKVVIASSKHPSKNGRVTVAGQLNVDVPIKTLKSIWKQAQLPEEN